MRIWQKEISVDILQAISLNSAPAAVGIEFLEVGDDFIKARLPVDHRTVWNGGLHSGINVVLAETLGSCGAHYATSPGTRAVGLSITANHLKSVTAGWVTGVTRPLRNDAEGQVWQIDIVDDAGALVCSSRITMALLQEQAPA